MKKTRITFVLISVAISWLIFAGCASKPPAPVAPPPEVATEPPPPVEEPVVAVVEPEPVVEEVPAAEITEKQVLAEEERQEALKAMARADEVQGKTSEKVAYNNAASVFANGERNMGKEDWDAAYFDFHSARESFDLLTARVGDKRQQAIDALRRSKMRAAESEAFALVADNIAPLTGEAE